MRRFVFGAHGSCPASTLIRQRHPRTASTFAWSLRISPPNRSNSTTPNHAPHSFEGYYEDLLDAPLHSIQSATRTPPTPPPTDELPKTEQEEQLAKARVVFGSRLAGPGERRAAIESASTNVAGILVPPRPEEPENCCMSGCVNCVWDLYRDEMEEWAAKSAEARARLVAQRKRTSNETSTNQQQQPPAAMPGHVAASMDDDGGGSSSNWEAMNGTESFGVGDPQKDIFEGIPVGIREFMKTEKKLKARRLQRGSKGG